MRETDHVLTPATEKHFFQEQLLPIFLKGENATVFRIANSGVRKEMQFLINYAEALGFKNLGKYRIIMVNPLSLASHEPKDFFRLICSSLFFDDIGSFDPYFFLIEQIKKLLSKDYHLIFLLVYFNKLNYLPEFFNNLHSFYQLGREKIHFVFLSSQNILEEKYAPKYDQLFKLIVQNKIYFPFLDEEDALFVAQKLNFKYKFNLNEFELKQAVNLAGGHPSLIRRCLASMKYSNARDKQLLTLLWEKEEIQLELKDIWEELTDEEKQVLINFEKGILESERITPYLIKMGFLREKKDKYSFFSPLFEKFVQEQKIEKPILSVSEQTGQILINGLPVKEKITLSEYKLLSAFLRQPNQVISRDKIAEVLWGCNFFEKYSDWTIDQMIFLIRKKLRYWGISPENLQTIKGWGYRWQS